MLVVAVVFLLVALDRGLLRPGFVNARPSVGGGQWPEMPADRDVTAFDERASRYEQGWLGRLHQDIVKRTIEVALLS